MHILSIWTNQNFFSSGKDVGENDATFSTCTGI